MRQVEFSPPAEADVEDIYSTSLRDFGRLRTERYFAELNKEMDRLADGYRLTAVRVTRRPERFRYRVASHYIYFYETKLGIYISRVLHVRRLQSRQTYPLPETE